METIAAAIDIGTNSVKLTVGRRGKDGRLDVLLDTTRITRLGKNVDADGRLQDAAMHQTLTVLASFGQDARNLGAALIAAVGTSALRDAANGAEFVTQAERDLGGAIEIISGDREAALTYAAARHDPDLDIAGRGNATLVTIDIGGGSTEIVIGRGESVTFRQSLQLGAVRVMERTAPSDPWTRDDLSRANQIADEALIVVPPLSGPVFVVGSGGTSANLAAMAIKATDADAPATPDAIHGSLLTLPEIDGRIAQLAAMPLAARRAMPGLEPDRADVIVAGAVVQARALHRLQAESLTVSARGLRFGLLYALLKF